jgi:hypothetical protein
MSLKRKIYIYKEDLNYEVNDNNIKNKTMFFFCLGERENSSSCVTGFFNENELDLKLKHFALHLYQCNNYLNIKRQKRSKCLINKNSF